MFKNVASQKVVLYAYDTSTGAAKTGDSGNLTFYVSKDVGSVTSLGDVSVSELHSTFGKGLYWCDLTQAETNADTLAFSGASATSNVVVDPQIVYTFPPNFTAQSIDANGRGDFIKMAGTTVTGRDIGASVLLSSGTGTGQVSLSSGRVAVQSNVVKGGALTGLSFEMTKSSDNSPMTGLTVASQYSHDGGASYASTSNSVTEIGSGGYALNLTSSETNYNTIFLRMSATSANDAYLLIVTQP